MKALIVVLTVAAFLQGTILPLDLVLIILICRSFLRADKANLYLAFAFGLLISHLTLTPLGLESIVFLLLVQILGSFSKSRLAQNPLSLVPICFFALVVNQVILWVFTHQLLQITPKFFEAVLSLPIFYLVRFWEERFIARKDIRLRV